MQVFGDGPASPTTSTQAGVLIPEVYSGTAPAASAPEKPSDMDGMYSGTAPISSDGYPQVASSEPDGAPEFAGFHEPAAALTASGADPDLTSAFQEPTTVLEPDQVQYVNEAVGTDGGGVSRFSRGMSF